MAINDPLGDLLARIRNGQLRGLAKISAPASKLRARVLDLDLHGRRPRVGDERGVAAAAEVDEVEE